MQLQSCREHSSSQKLGSRVKQSISSVSLAALAAHLARHYTRCVRHREAARSTSITQGSALRHADNRAAAQRRDSRVKRSISSVSLAALAGHLARQYTVTASRAPVVSYPAQQLHQHPLFVLARNTDSITECRPAELIMHVRQAWRARGWRQLRRTACGRTHQPGSWPRTAHTACCQRLKTM